ncbi:MAG: hypothetical protein DHS20C16_14570 [Phycisphaerae bacterium]|nr:MAG: hypothetical protein DHS20C16_14570 [Phycisphaerae bacterium]
MSDSNDRKRKPLEPIDEIRTIDVDKALSIKRQPSWLVVVIAGVATFFCGLLLALKLNKSERLDHQAEVERLNASIDSLNGQIGSLQQKIFTVNSDLRSAKSSLKWADDRASEKQSTINDLRRQLNPRRRQSTNSLKQYYDQLLVFKDTQEFRSLGLSVASPHHRWMKEVDARSEDQSLTFRERVAFGELLQLALEYVSTRGSENEMTRRLRGFTEDAISGE